MRISHILVTIDKACEYIPFVGIATSFLDACLIKFARWYFKPDQLATRHYWHYLDEKGYGRCGKVGVAAAIPLFGQIGLYVSDHRSSSADGENKHLSLNDKEDSHSSENTTKITYHKQEEPLGEYATQIEEIKNSHTKINRYTETSLKKPDFIQMLIKEAPEAFNALEDQGVQKVFKVYPDSFEVFLRHPSRRLKENQEFILSLIKHDKNRLNEILNYTSPHLKADSAFMLSVIKEAPEQLDLILDHANLCLTHYPFSSNFMLSVIQEAPDQLDLILKHAGLLLTNRLPGSFMLSVIDTVPDQLDLILKHAGSVLKNNSDFMLSVIKKAPGQFDLILKHAGLDLKNNSDFMLSANEAKKQADS